MEQSTDENFSQDVSFKYHKCPVRWATSPAFYLNKLSQKEVNWFAQIHPHQSKDFNPSQELLSGGYRPEPKSFLNHLLRFTILFVFSIPRGLSRWNWVYVNSKMILEMQQKLQKDNLHGMTYRFQPMFCSKMLRVLQTQSSFSSTSWLSGSNSFLPCLLLPTTNKKRAKPGLNLLYTNRYFWPSMSRRKSTKVECPVETPVRILAPRLELEETQVFFPQRTDE